VDRKRRKKADKKAKEIYEVVRKRKKPVYWV
jgi:hypothetical protein